MRHIEDIRNDLRDAKAALNTLPDSVIRSGLGDDYQDRVDSLEDELQEAETSQRMAAQDAV